MNGRSPAHSNGGARPRANSADRVSKPGLSSIYLIEVEAGKRAYRYEVEVKLLPKNRPKKSLTGGSVDFNRRISAELVAMALRQSGQLASPLAAHVYDGRRILHTSEQLKEFAPAFIKGKDTSKFVQDNFLQTDFQVIIKPCDSHFGLDLNNLTQYKLGNGSVEGEDRSLRTFLELAVAQKALESGKFIAIGSGKMFNRQQEGSAYDGHILFHAGLCKGVRIVKGAQGKEQAAVVLDAKVAAFLKPQRLNQTIADVQSNRRNWEDVCDFVRGIKVQCLYNRGRIIIVGGFGRKPLKDETFTRVGIDGKDEVISVVQYLEGTYKGLKLQDVDKPGVHPIGRPNEIYPAEQLFVLEGQKIPMEKQTPDLVEILLSKNSVAPQARHQKIAQAGAELDLWSGKNNVLKAFGIKVREESNDTQIDIRPLPNLLYKGGKRATPSWDKGDWSKSSGAFIDVRPAPRKWMVIFEEANSGIVKTFVDKLLAKCREKGLAMDEPAPWKLAQKLFDLRTREPLPEEWKKCFQKVATDGYNFLLMIDSKKKYESHGLLKLFEVFGRSKTPLLTQQIAFETVKNVVEQNRWQTLNNIVNKFNTKFGGLNYRPVMPEPKQPALARFEQRFDPGNNEILVIGYDVSHPKQKIHERKKSDKDSSHGGGDGEEKMELEEEEEKITSTEPSVVGICANMAENPHNFVGDYFYQASRKESLDLDQLQARAKWILWSLEQNRPKHARPKLVFLMRDGLSEGQFSMAYQEEFKAIKAGFREHDPNYKPSFVLLISTKRHYKKFFAGQTQLENMPPGSIVGGKMVRPDVYLEFYMQAHFPIKGTGKAVEYDVLVNDIKFGLGLDELKEYAKLMGIKSATQEQLEKQMFERSLQNLLMMLSYDHQIVSKAISLVEPVYQADELAKRGHANFQALKHFYPNDVPYTGQERNGHPLIDNQALTAKLSYWGDGTIALKKRFTA